MSISKHKNFAVSTVATAPSPASSGTSLVLQTGDGAKFPTGTFPAVIYPTGTNPTTANAEVVTASVSGDTVTLVRAQEGSSARTVVVGDNFIAAITAGVLQQAEGDPGICEGRLTLTSGTPVTTADVTGAATVYFTPYKGNRITLYDGTNTWVNRTFVETSLALGTITNDLPYDVFAYDNSGTLALELLAWTSKTARATALVLQDGVLVKTGATTRRYLGTFHTTATTTTEDSNAKRLLWNYYNRVTRQLRVLDVSDTWTYSTQTWRQANASAANQLAVVIGVAEVMVSIVVNVVGSVSGATVAFEVAIGYDSTTTPTTGGLFGFTLPSVAGALARNTASLVHYPAVGKHDYVWLEEGNGTATMTWFGDNGSANYQSGIQGTIEG